MEDNIKKKRIKSVLSIINLIVITLTLMGCSLLPKDEEARSIVLEKTEEIPEYQMTAVSHGDLQLHGKIYCVYTQKDGEELSFGGDGQTLKAVYVSTGDEVKKGDLLAEAELGDIDESIEELKYLIQKLELSRDSLKKQYDLSEQLLQLYNQAKTTQEDSSNELFLQEIDKLEVIKKAYNKQLETNEEDLYLQKLRLADLEKKRSEGRIYAGMDGVVTYVKQNLLDNKLNSKDTIIKVMDQSECVFKADTDWTDRFTDGQEVTLTLSNGSQVDTTVSKNVEEKNVLYFVITNLEEGLTVGTRATYELILQEKKDVLQIPSAAVRQTEDFYFVYVENEDGMREMKKIEIGLIGDDCTEVVSGLSKDEVIILK